MKAPNPGRGWRLLEVGEVIPEGETVINARSTAPRWNAIISSGKVHDVGDREIGLYYRTRATKPTPKPLDGWDVAKAMYKALGGRTAKTDQGGPLAARLHYERAMRNRRKK